ncbi:hypothetical protein BAE44_0004692, partial [Dichanthelium oligosanthes]
MSALAASRRLLHLRPGLELCLLSRPLTPVSSWYLSTLIPTPGPTLVDLSPKFTNVSFCRGKGMAHFPREPPHRNLVSCRAFEEGNAAKDKAMPSLDEQLSHCKDGSGTALDPIVNNFPNELAQLSLEEEASDDVVCGISESVVRDAGKAAIELLAARAFTVSELRKKLRSKNYPVDAVDAVVADFKSRSGGTEENFITVVTDHFKNPFGSFTSYASAALGPSDESDGLGVLGASAGASAGLGADADPLGASELDAEELEVLAPSAKGATATAARRITTSARARAMAES